ncbi:hypothetical protein NE857_13375 [Nocardiopsis exhalans]|uniref:Uncharacterized protein n=1 Tax=Nocardiopsis exhalans TaxID=163604 RepID=A0ABY5DGJ4_9ACTN|nr:hypothetical protein [Nocardiopsis exhalans]USY22509.1 hypothetical protein NE857_13375 [Nocardiopsis exhalans]
MTTPPAQPPRQTVVFVNVNRTWPSVEQGDLTEAEVTLGDWNPYKSNSRSLLAFDPDDVVLVLAYRRGEVLAAFDVDEHGVKWLTSYDPHRIRWSGVPSTRWARLVGADSPVKWRQGEGVALKSMSMEELQKITSAPGSDSGHDRDPHRETSTPPTNEVTVSVAGVTVTVQPPSTTEVIVPDGMDVLVKRR